MSRRIILLSVALVTCFPAGFALASDKSMRCGRHLIHAGGLKDSASQYEVLKKCGQPEAKMGESWVYIQGNMSRTLTFNYEGRLQRIDSARN